MSRSRFAWTRERRLAVAEECRVAEAQAPASFRRLLELVDALGEFICSPVGRAPGACAVTGIAIGVALPCSCNAFTCAFISAICARNSAIRAGAASSACASGAETASINPGSGQSFGSFHRRASLVQAMASAPRNGGARSCDWLAEREARFTCARRRLRLTSSCYSVFSDGSFGENQLAEAGLCAECRRNSRGESRPATRRANWSLDHPGRCGGGSGAPMRGNAPASIRQRDRRRRSPIAFIGPPRLRLSPLRCPTGERFAPRDSDASSRRGAPATRDRSANAESAHEADSRRNDSVRRSKKRDPAALMRRAPSAIAGSSRCRSCRSARAAFRANRCALPRRRGCGGTSRGST